MINIMHGILITIEGIDGCGKSTLMKNLHPRLKNLPIVYTQEPGGTPLGTHLRTIVQQQTTPLDPKAEFLLFAADRAQHFLEVINPALAAHKIIISDRLADSSVVYQGYARGLDIAMIKTVNSWAMGNKEPDLTFFIAIDPEIAYHRTRSRNEALSTFEKEKLSFMQRAAYGYQELFKNKTNVITLDGSLSAEDLAQKAVHAIKDWLRHP